MFSVEWANMHMHSTYSDAGFTPTQLVLIGKSLGYGALALTDHETDGGCKEFMRVATAMGIKSVTGVELYGKVEGYTVHLTGLDFDSNHPAIRDYIDGRVAAKNEHTRKCVEYGLEKGIIEGITWDDVVNFCGEGAWLCYDSVKLALRLKNGKVNGNLREDVFKVPELKALKPKHPPAELPIRAVREAGGVITLAHPEEVAPLYIDKLVELGLNGIEIDTPDMSEKSKTFAREAAARYNLYCSGGTDHSGPMSCCGGEYAIPVFNGISEEQFQTLVERRLG